MLFPSIIMGKPSKRRKGKYMSVGGRAEQIPPAGTFGEVYNWLVKGIADKQIASPLKASVVSS